MPIDFPDAPSTGDTHTVGDKTWTWDGTAWNVVTSSGSDHGNLGGLGDDDHTQYALADGTRGTFETSGAVSTHEAAADPHNQYLLADGTRTATELTVTGDLTIDTSTLHVDSTNNRVGIGTTTPDAPLHLNGAGDGVDQIKISSTGGTLSEYGFLAADASTDVMRYGYWTGSGFGNHHFEGNVGINDNTPSYTLDVNGTLRATGEIRADGNISLRYGNGVHDSIYRVGGIFFTWDSDSYGTNAEHCIRSTNGDSWGDHITINSFGNIRMNIDSNGNGSNTFTIGRQTTGTANTLFTLNESGNLTVTGEIGSSNLTTSAKYLGTGVSYDTNRNKKVSHGLAVYRSYSGGSNAPTTYDIALQVVTTDSGMEFAANWLNSTAGPLYFRTLRDCCQNWTAWSTISLTAPSDIRTKTNVTEISNPRSIVEQLNAIEYDRVNSDGTLGDVDPDELLDNMARLPRPREHGFVAQDLIQVLPFMVDYNPSFDEVNEHGWASAYTVQYERLVPVLTETIKELYAKTDAQEAIISDLTARIEALEAN